MKKAPIGAFFYRLKIKANKATARATAAATMAQAQGLAVWALACGRAVSAPKGTASAQAQSLRLAC